MTWLLVTAYIVILRFIRVFVVNEAMEIAGWTVLLNLARKWSLPYCVCNILHYLLDIVHELLFIVSPMLSQHYRILGVRWTLQPLENFTRSFIHALSYSHLLIHLLCVNLKPSIKVLRIMSLLIFCTRTQIHHESMISQVHLILPEMRKFIVPFSYSLREY